ncbi:WYL domain-containing protein [Paenibacillus psychroresistens]|uniref:WYL domain-containing protein n=1 Tax=Paenibacillus psychroresistens TaxID=1778678 RepID=A0A6B8RDB9_9BACL|nr:WYL domain-containing protein [Paenibacillus psychroresistens]QGQ93927.1 WYL domain-containing protein [Paenibacillus psychroresistens]
MRLHRLIAILILIESRGRMKAKDLAFALETSTRSIYRDIDILAEAGIPIVTTTGPSGGVYLMEGYTVNLKQLNGEDVVNLYLTGMGIYTGDQTESGMQLKNALLKLEKTLPDSYQSDIQKAKRRFYYDDTPWWTERIVIPCLEALRIAVWRTQKLLIQYSKVNGDSSMRRLHPYGLVVKKADWYLIAYCEAAQEIRTFNCARIVKAELIEGDFEIPPDFSLENHWNLQDTLFKQVCKEDEYYPVIIKLSKDNAEVLQRVEVIQSIQEETQLQVTINMYSYEAACLGIMDIIGQAEIIEPEILRQYAKSQINRIQDLYTKICL